MSFFNNLEWFKENILINYSEGECYTYQNIINISDEIYSQINHRTLVFCLCKNHPGAMAGYISFLRNKVVPVMLDASLDDELLNELIDDYKPEYLWLPQEQLIENFKENVVFSTLNYSLVKLKIDTPFILHDDLALLLTTSGSTGSPKLVRLSYENLKTNAESIAQYLDIDKSERPITALPMNYSFGMSIINSHLIKGATVLLTSRALMEKEFWSFLRDQKATSFSGVPYTYEILKKLRFFRMELPSLKTLTQAGGKLNNELVKEFSLFCRNTGKRFFVMYGQTEASPRMSYLPPEYALAKLGSMGIPIPGGDFSLIDDNGEEIHNAEVIGELVYKGRNVSLGYAEKGDDLQKGDDNKGVLYTGDLAKRDEDGFFYIVGRKKRFIKLYGNRVNLDETERMLKNIITGCACNGVDDHMIIYITDESRTDEVKEYISAKTKINHVAFSVKYIPEIPVNSSGKTIYSKLEI